MLDFLEQNLTAILAAITAFAGALVTVFSTVKMFKSEIRTKRGIAKLTNDINITQDGIVEAFKKSKIGSEWKVDISKQVDKKLDAWSERTLALIKEREELLAKLMVANTQILAYTAAFDKLSTEDKQKIQELINQIVEADTTIEV